VFLIIWNNYRGVNKEEEGKKPPKRPRRRWVDIIKMDLREIEWGGMEWIDLSRDRDQ
jgi:hypothetical protein